MRMHHGSKPKTRARGKSKDFALEKACKMLSIPETESEKKCQIHATNEAVLFSGLVLGSFGSLEIGFILFNSAH